MKPKANYGRHAGLAGAAVIALLLSACNPAPKYARPPAQAPTAFKEAAPQEYKENQGWRPARPGDERIRGKWWELYNDPQLNALEEQVQTQNQNIAQAEANFRQARALVVSARSQLYPTIGTSPSYSNTRTSQTARGAFVVGNSTGITSTTSSNNGSTTGTSTSGTGTGTGNSGSSTNSGSTSVGGSSTSGVFNNFAFPLDVSYEVDLWHRVRNNIAQNQYAAQASAADLATALLSTQAELAQDYFEVRALDAQRKILEETVENYRRTLQLTQSLYQTGIDSEEEVAQAQTQLDTTTAQETDLGVSRANFEHAIAVLTGRPPATFSLPVAPFRPNPPEIPVEVPSDLLERRPDIAAAERRVAASNAAIGVARAAYYPNLTLSASGGLQTSHFAQWFNWPSRFWSVGPTLSQVLFDAGARRGATEQAEAAYDASVASYRSTVLSAFQAVEDQLSALTILSKEASQEQTAVLSAGHYLDLALTRFKTGVESYLNVITAQTALLSNRETELQVQLRQMTASVSLVMALGGGWDPAQLPQMKDLTARPPHWKPATESPLSPASAPAAPNPPPLPANLALPSAPATSSQSNR
jgi:NodT family efflux transporter outer membrane factor (OMF) lipoprotein